MSITYQVKPKAHKHNRTGLEYIKPNDGHQLELTKGNCVCV